MFLNGHGILTPSERGEPVVDDSFLVLFHADADAGAFVLPQASWGAAWRRVLDTERGFAAEGEGERYEAGATVAVLGRSLWLLRLDA